jgi:hypothetical protein
MLTIFQQHNLKKIELRYRQTKNECLMVLFVELNLNLLLMVLNFIDISFFLDKMIKLLDKKAVSIGMIPVDFFKRPLLWFNSNTNTKISSR